MSKDSKRVKIRVLPLRGIGGIGKAGDEAMVGADEAKKWVDEGYAMYVKGNPVEVPSDQKDAEEK